MIRLLFIFAFVGISISAQQTVYGKITDEEQHPIPATLVMNMKTGFQAYSDLEGNFSINGNFGDEIRFVRKGYERVSLLFNNENQRYVSITLYRVAVAIEEVKIEQVKLTGNLETDSRNLTKIDKAEILNAEIGVPKPPEKPRETPPPTVKEVGVLRYALSNVMNFNNLYKNISGDARRMRTQYRYEDLQDNILWIRKRLDDDYFTEAGIPEEKISEFIAFSFHENPQIVTAIKAKNLTKAMFLMEEKMPIYLERLKVN